MELSIRPTSPAQRELAETRHHVRGFHELLLDQELKGTAHDADFPMKDLRLYPLPN
jgi:hypothetical protein